MDRKITKPFDYIALLLFLFLIAVSFLSLNKKADTLEVTANGYEYRFPLSEDATYAVEGALGVTVIEVKDKEIRFLDSPCPNKTCIAKGFQDTVVCLPNKVVATTEKTDTGEIDGFSR